MDTDSFLLNINTNDLIENLITFIDVLDFSSLKRNQDLVSNRN